MRRTYMPIGLGWEDHLLPSTDAPRVPKNILVSIIISGPLSRSKPGRPEPGRAVAGLIGVVVVFAGLIFARVGTVFPSGFVG